MQTPKTAGGDDKSHLLRHLPSVARLVDDARCRPLLRRYGRLLVTHLARRLLDEVRKEVRSGAIPADGISARTDPGILLQELERRAEEVLKPSPRRVVNATGVVIHTNLGRAVLGADAARRVAEVGRSYVDLEYDLRTGRRGSRMAHLAPLMDVLFPGRSFLVVNNNAAAVFLALRALARRKEVLISRGELVEIGGSFRIPDILQASGAKLREVGTTNRTRLGDYREASSKRTGAILKVHPSNFRIQGFQEEAPVSELRDLARSLGVPLIVDWGSGDLEDLTPLSIHDETPVHRVLETGADVVTFSGDKLLGGPQAGFLVGRPDLLERIRKDPLARALRLDKLQIAALRETLASYVRGRAFDEIPVLAMLAQEPGVLDRRARRIVERLGEPLPDGWALEVSEAVSKTGGGSSPSGERPTRVLTLRAPAARVRTVERRLREGEPPVVGRIQDDTLLLDLRTVQPDEDDVLARRLSEALGLTR